ncbi:MAG: GNAT family N-acetyltransferase [Treponema sp.]|nr:GNAT family N-acetyltransferase [Treponema sp.]
MQLKRIKTYSERDLKDLFSSIGWKSAKEPQILVQAFNNASHVVSAWEDDKLIGIIRSMDDGCWSANIDCLVVHKDFQNKGIASTLITEILKNLSNIKYINICPDNKNLIVFYEKFGFKIIEGCYLQKTNLL